jgi:hypothetical protein
MSTTASKALVNERGRFAALLLPVSGLVPTCVRSVFDAANFNELGVDL